MSKYIMAIAWGGLITDVKHSDDLDELSQVMDFLCKDDFDPHEDDARIFELTPDGRAVEVCSYSSDEDEDEDEDDE